MIARSMLFALLLSFLIVSTIRASATNSFCADQLSREQKLGISLSEPTFAQPPLKQIRRLRNRVEQILAYAGAFVPQAELDRLVASLNALEANDRFLSEHRRTITNVIEATEAALTKDFREKVDQVIPALVLNAEIEEANGNSDRSEPFRRLIDQLHAWRSGGLSFTSGAKEWARAKHEAAVIAALHPGILLELAVRRASLAKVDAKPTGGDFAFARDLGIFGVTDRGRTFEAYLKIRYVAPSAVEREERRAKASHKKSGAKPRHLRIEDLTRALSFFKRPPLVGATGSKVTLDGYAKKNGQVVKVSAVFDPRLRYFTVKDPKAPDGLAYHQMIPDAEGRLTFVDQPTVDQDVAAQRLDLTHFAF